MPRYKVSDVSVDYMNDWLFTAPGPECAAELAVELFERESADYQIAAGYETMRVVVKLADGTGPTYIYEVSGKALPAYTARELKPE